MERQRRPTAAAQQRWRRADDARLARLPARARPPAAFCGSCSARDRACFPCWGGRGGRKDACLRALLPRLHEEARHGGLRSTLHLQGMVRRSPARLLHSAASVPLSFLCWALCCFCPDPAVNTVRTHPALHCELLTLLACSPGWPAGGRRSPLTVTPQQTTVPCCRLCCPLLFPLQLCLCHPACHVVKAVHMLCGLGSQDASVRKAAEVTFLLKIKSTSVNEKGHAWMVRWLGK